VLDLAIGGKMLWEFLLAATAATDVSARNRIARVEVVPWSMAST